MRHLKFALWVIVAAFTSSWQASAQATATPQGRCG